jgi:uncharacterized protein (DUF4415 family)
MRIEPGWLRMPGRRRTSGTTGAVLVRLDEDLIDYIDYFGGYQTLINSALRE